MTVLILPPKMSVEAAQIRGVKSISRLLVDVPDDLVFIVAIGIQPLFDSETWLSVF